MLEPLHPSASFAGYRIVRPLGRGHAGATYLAASRAGTAVVLRVFPRPGTLADARALLEEQERIAGFRHPFAVPVLDAGFEDDTFYVVREFVEGLLLRDVPTSRNLHLPLLAASAEAVEAAHEHGIVHGSLGPTNLIAVGPRQVRVVDFGALTSVQGSAAAEAPEVVEGVAPTTAADVYGLAALAREANVRGTFLFRVPSRALSPNPRERPPIAVVADQLARLQRRPLAPEVEREAADTWAGLLGSVERPAPLPAEEPPPPTAEERARWRSTGPYLEHSARARALPPSPPRPVVNTGFERPDRPGHRLARTTLLRPHTDYEFTLDIGPLDPEAIDTKPTSLPADLPAGARLTVTVHPVAGGVAMADEVRLGTLVLRRDGTAAAEGRDDDRLRFPLRTGDAGRVRLRASILHGTTLVQSRLVTASVGEPGRTGGRGRIRQRTELDYALATELTPANVAPFRHAADVSLMLNGDDDTHALQIATRADGDGDVLLTHGAWFDATELQTTVDTARAALSRIAWGAGRQWQKGDAYRYEEPAAAPDRLDPDLIRLAVTGYRLYSNCFNALTGSSGVGADALSRTLRPSLRIQLASCRGARLLLPIALFYDAPLNTSIPAPELTICDAYRTPTVADSPCLGGECPHHEDQSVVCPSGFWGFRHAIGLPLSLRTGPGGADVLAATAITHDREGPTVSMAVSTDPEFALRGEHEGKLNEMIAPRSWRYADDLAVTIKLLKATDNQLFYFYCHGGLLKGTPFLQVGPVTELGMTSDMVRSQAIRWRDPSRPLVFINGCHTTAVEPKQLFDFVSELVENASAAGVVGTEITTFEPLAGTFAIACLRRFLAGNTLGEAIRGARLELLQNGNPLGLIYTPFAMPSLRLVAA